MKPLLSVNNLTHLYAPGKGFSDVSFDLWPGEVLGIVGESGSGKTTLLKSLSARLTPQNGDILYDGHSLYGLSGAWCISTRWMACAARCRRGATSANG